MAEITDVCAPKVDKVEQVFVQQHRQDTAVLRQTVFVLLELAMISAVLFVITAQQGVIH